MEVRGIDPSSLQQRVEGRLRLYFGECQAWTESWVQLTLQDAL